MTAERWRPVKQIVADALEESRDSRHAAMTANCAPTNLTIRSWTWIARRMGSDHTAIKVIERGMDTDAVLRRFYAERQILARLRRLRSRIQIITRRRPGCDALRGHGKCGSGPARGIRCTRSSGG
ncbi:MAG TPA: hypothetical protein VNV86_17440 [Candidatus Acidoferrum sp.]|nr:hypothetical protein [Candidatus Acidoferrum sp.]